MGYARPIRGSADMKVNRRRVLSLLALGAGATPAQAAGPSVAFAHGVASGDPLHDRVVIWTRATPADAAAPVDLTWEVAADPQFARRVAGGRAVAAPGGDHTVKVDVARLKPATDYWYRFHEGTTVSPVGRTRTLPAAHVDEVVLAFVTCALYPAGHFNAYDHIARSERLDAVVELGDYIYEYGAQPGDYGMATGVKLGRIPEPAHDIVTLADYRTRYAQYRRDPDLQAAHARAPWICVWDDHEVANDTWRGGAENHHEKTEGAFDDRKAAALRAWYEWMPIRDPVPGRAFEAINRSFDFGDLLSLTMLESRLTARSYQLEYERAGDIAFIPYDMTDADHPARVADPAQAARLTARAAAGEHLPKPYAMGPDTAAIEAFVADPGRQMLGAEQEAWLDRTLHASARSGKPWQVVGNQVVMARARAPDIAKFVGRQRLAAMLAAQPEAVRRRAEALLHAWSFDQPFDLDGWDGYPAARARFDAIVDGLPAGQVIVLSGDSHAFWANQLMDAGATRPLAVEFGVSSVTSPSIGDQAGFQLGAVFSAQNKEIAFCDQLAKGYVRLTLRHDGATAEMIRTPVDVKPYQASTVATWVVKPRRGAARSPLQRA